MHFNLVDSRDDTGACLEEFFELIGVNSCSLFYWDTDILDTIIANSCRFDLSITNRIFDSCPAFQPFLLSTVRAMQKI